MKNEIQVSKLQLSPKLRLTEHPEQVISQFATMTCEKIIFNLF